MVQPALVQIVPTAILVFQALPFPWVGAQGSCSRGFRWELTALVLTLGDERSANAFS